MNNNEFEWLATILAFLSVRFTLEMYSFVVYASNFQVVSVVCFVGGGSPGVVRETRHRPLLLVSLVLPVSESPALPADWPGPQHTQSSTTETLNGVWPHTVA